ncbi:MAG: asparaginase domain-containing protein [Clostridiales Family XIII bacterium]|jgi:L-asparaginase|nr:asparaginase domain-containing protein [Clostridiales Family XIII bacterium]
MKIHIIYTGGTIGSAMGRDGALAVSDAQSAMDDDFPAASGRENATRGDAIIFSVSRPLRILSENMDAACWNLLIDHIRSLHPTDADALFVTHGTDNLAYTANLLALLLHGLTLPVFLISSDRPLRDKRANGRANFDEAVRMTRIGASPGVYVPYRNTDGVMRVHRGERLLQAGDFSDGFSSVTDPGVNNLTRIARMIREDADKPLPNAEKPLLYALNAITTRVASIRPYPDIRYDLFDPTRTDVILHGTYHSFTAAESLIGFAKRARENNIDVCLAPMLSRSEKMYESTKRILDSGLVRPLYDMSFEMAYAYLLIRPSVPKRRA